MSSLLFYLNDNLTKVRDVTTPPHLNKDCLLAVSAMSGDTWIMCAESSDDKK